MVLGNRLNEGDFIEIAFQTRSGLVHGMAEMLTPTRVFSDGCLQPFRFIAISDEDHRKLRMAVDSVMDSSFLGAGAKHVTAVRGL